MIKIKKLIFLLLLINTSHLNSMHISDLWQESASAKKIFALSVASILGYNMLHRFISYHLSPFYIKNKTVIQNLSNVEAAIEGFQDASRPSLLIGALIVGASRIGSLPKLEWADLIKPGLATLGIITVFSLFDGYRKALYYDHEEMVNGRTGKMKTSLINKGPEQSKRFVASAFANDSKQFWGTIAAIGLPLGFITMRYMKSRNA